MENLKACKEININLLTENFLNSNLEIKDKYVLVELTNNSSFYPFMKFIMELGNSKDLLLLHSKN